MKKPAPLPLLLLCIAVLSISFSKPRTVKKLDIQGFTVYVREDTVEHPELNAILDIMDDRITVIKKLVSKDQFAFFQSVPIWIDWQQDAEHTMRYNPSRKWCVKHGQNPGKAHSVELLNSKGFVNQVMRGSPLVLLHEFAHAWHFQVVGLKDPSVRNAFMHAYATASYDDVSTASGYFRKAYAMKNYWEYFAELSEAYFGDNDYFPHNREQLKQFDSVGYALMCRVWKD